MFGHTNAAPPPIAGPAPAPAPITPEEDAELAAAKRRIPPKWDRLDGLLNDFRAGDDRLRIVRG